MASTANLFHEDFKTARSGYRRAGNVDKQSELNHLSSSHVQRSLHARNTGEGGVSLFPQIYCGNLSERAKRLERRLRPHATLSAYELAYTPRVGESTICSAILRGSKSGPSGRVLQLLADFFGASFPQEVFSGPDAHCFDPRDAQIAEMLRKIAEERDELRRPTTKSVQQKNRRLNWRRTS